MPPTRRRTAVIITAIPVECVAVCEHLDERSSEPDSSGTVYERGLFRPETKSEWDVVVVEAGAGNIHAALEAQKAISKYKPDVAIFVGVAGGLKDVGLGDVVAANKVYGYESGKAEQEFRTRPALQVSSHRMIQRAMAERRRQGWWSRILGIPPETQPKAWVGPIAAGEKVVASTASETYRLLRSTYGDALAVEMEGYGFLSATHSNPQVEALVVRGISDMVDGKSNADSSGSQERAARAASAFCFELLAHLDFRSPSPRETAPNRTPREAFRPAPHIDAFIKEVKLSRWRQAAQAALHVISMTDAYGNNEIFQGLLDYQDCSEEDDRFWGALHTVECCVRLAPWLLTHEHLSRMASHDSFSVRSSAACICMDLAHSVPGQVPLDILLRLSAHDEDWYVERPANAALKAMLRSFPEIQEIFFARLQSAVSDERTHAAIQFSEVAEHEPELLDASRLRKALTRLTHPDDTEAAAYLKRAVSKLRGISPPKRYRYGL